MTCRTGDAVLLEVHLVVLVAVQVAHQFLEAWLHPSFSAGGRGYRWKPEAVGVGNWSRLAPGGLSSRRELRRAQAPCGAGSGPPA